METQDITAVLPSGKQQTVTLAVSAKVQELKEILQRCFDQQFLVILDARGAVLRVDGMIPSAASVTCVARFPCLASTWKAFALWCHNDRVVTWGHPAYGSDSSGVCKRLRKVVQIVASGRAFAAVTSYGSVVTWGLPKMVADTAMVRQQLYDVRNVTAAAQGETQDGDVHPHPGPSGQAVMLQLDHAILIGSEFQVEAANARTFRIAQQATFKELRLRKLLGRIAEAQNQQSRGRQPPAILIRRIFSHPFVVREGLQSLGEAREWAQQELRSHVQSTQTEQLQAWRERMRNSSAKPLGCVAQPPDAMGGQVPTVWKSIRQILLQKPNAKLRDTDHALPAKDLRPIAIQSVIWRAIASAWTRRPQTRAWVTSWVHSSACGGIQGKSVDTSIPQGDAISPLTLLAVLTGLTGRVLQARPEPHTLVTFLDDRNMVAKTPELAARLWDTWKQLSPKVGLKENEEKIQIVARQAAFKPRLIAAGFDETHIVQGTWLGTVRSWLQSLNWHEEAAWTWIHPDIQFRLDWTQPIDENTKQREHHALREAWRRQQFQQFLSSGRRDATAVQGSVYQEARAKLTRQTYQSSNTHSRACLIGAVVSDARLDRIRDPNTAPAPCKWCASGNVPTWDHLAWDCPAFAATRTSPLHDLLQRVLGWPTGRNEQVDAAILTHLGCVRERVLDRRYRNMAGCARGSFFVQKLRGWDGVPREGDSQKPKLAKAPASEALQASTSPQRGPDRCSLAQRLAAGRTLELLTTLMVVHFLKICAAKVTQLQPRGGLFAFRDDQPVFILSVWTSRKITLADVVPLKQATFQGRTVLKAKYTETRTCRWSELKDVGLHFQVANCANDRRGASLLFQKQPGETQGDQGRALRENAALAALWQAGNAELGLATSCTVDHSVRSVVPRLQAHLAERAASGITHHAAPRADESRSFWILDLPLPVQVDGRRHRCHTCAHLRIFDNCTVETHDVVAAYPDLRALVEQICGNALSLNVAGRMKEFCSAVPKSVSIRSILMAALEDYTKAASREMQRLINVYSGSVIRGDGNQDVAKRIAMYDEAGQKTHPYTVLLAWVTVDGALFQPVTAAETEDWVDLQPDLDAVVTNLKQDRLASGLSLAEAAPVAHATDSFRKQRLLLDAFYKNKYPKEQEVEVSAASPDAPCLIADHKDILQRLSLKPRVAEDVPPVLSEPGLFLELEEVHHPLLKSVVEDLQEGVTLAADFGFTENVCFECADTWLQLDALEFDPPRRSGDGSGRADVPRIRLLYKPDLHGDDGLVIVSSDEEDVISPQHAPPDVH
ncbi:unnamed protein product [Cladocopium goreaui]|uniref:Reverse transcriptase domain-containing protein n=1 Tax=Cladocopium goreaui TaxID=2562237 RepID=A0A9P1CRA3_9DINO|nr:unnamed protein product [Cladocopium goreaui]